MELSGVSHIGLCVADLARSLAFYTALLGFEEKSRLEVQGALASQLLQLAEVDLEAVYLQRGDFTLELLHYRSPGAVDGETPRPMNQRGLTHISLQSPDPGAALETFRAAGVAVLEPTVVRVGDVVMAFLLQDPDGQILEITATPGGSDD